MKRRFIVFGLIVLAIVLPFALFGCDKKVTNLDFYQIEVQVDEENKTLDCSQSIIYHNNSENCLLSVSFFVYANAFTEGQKAVGTAYLDKAYPNGESFGQFCLNKVVVDGQEADFCFEKPSILTVEVGQLWQDEQVQIEMDYTISLANINHRLGYGENTINCGNFFPIACVYENGQFNKPDFSNIGDPFYSQTANFEVKICHSADYVLACTGQQKQLATKDDRVSVFCEAENVRDFCFVLSPKFEFVRDFADDVEIRYYFYDQADAEHYLQTAKKAVETFERLFGEYPYKQLSVVKSNFCYGGMEYPNLVLISDAIVDSQTTDYVIVHEIAHQWWYGLVGSNQFDNAWQDEGLTEFSTALFFEHNPEYELKYQQIMQNATTSYKQFVKVFSSVLGDIDQSMTRSLTEFDTEPEYVSCVYTKGMLMFDWLREDLGDKKFFKALREYLETYKFQTALPQDLISVFCKQRNLKKGIEAWLGGTVVLN